MTPRAARWSLAAILLARLLLGFAYSAVNPLGEAPDEADHYAYAASIGREGRLPQGFGMTQAKHPPLYHILAGIAGLPGGLDFTFLRSNPDVSVFPGGAAPNFFVHTSLEAWPWRGGTLSMHLGRLVSVLAGVVLVATTFGIGRRLWPRDPRLAVMGAAFVAFLPESLFVGGSMSNDMLAAMFCALALLAALWTSGRSAGRHPSTVPLQGPAQGAGVAGAVLTGVLMALAFLTKVSCVALWPVAIGILVLPPGARNLRDRQTWRGVARRLPAGLLAGAAALLCIAPWLWRNLQLHGDPMGTPLVLATIDQRTAPLTLSDLGWLFKGWFLSFWGRFGGAGHIPLPAVLYLLWAAIVMAAALGWLRAALRRERGTPTQWLVLLGAPVLTAVTMIAYTRIALGTDQGRLLFPALAPIGLLVAGGVGHWLPRGARADTAAAAGWGAGLAAVAVAALFLGIIGPFAPPAAPAAADVARARYAGQSWGQSLTLQAIDWPRDGNPVLHWQTTSALAADLRTAVRVLGADGALLWEWRRSPGAGRFSTDRWPAGRLVADEYRPPADVLAAAGRIEVGVYEFGADELLAPDGMDGSYYTLEAPAR